MNTLDDLRNSLQAHSHDVEPLDLPSRAAQVRDRVRVVRRRRTAGAVAAAVAVLATAGGVALLPGDRTPGPAGPVPVPEELAGHSVPPTIEAAGWTYEYVSSVTAPEHVEVELEASDQPRLIAWANEQGGGKVVQPGGITYQPTAADFSQYWRTSPDLAGTFRFHGSGDNALAIYELSDERPPGVTVEGLTFRDRVAGDRLVNADAARGESTLRMAVDIPEGVLRLGVLCKTGADAEAPQVEVLLGGEPLMGRGRCDAATTFDPGALTSVTFGQGLATDTRTFRAGDVAEVEVRLLDQDGQLYEAGAQTLLAAGFYELAPPARDVAGHPVPEAVELDGTTWVLERSGETSPGEPLRTRTNEDEPAVVFFHVSGVPEGRTARLRFGGQDTEDSLELEQGTAGPFFAVRDIELAGEVDGPAPRARVGFTVYTRLD